MVFLPVALDVQPLLIAAVMVSHDEEVEAIGPQQARLAEVMRKLGWVRANNARTISVKQRMVVGWVKGERPWPLVKLDRFDEALVVEEPST